MKKRKRSFFIIGLAAILLLAASVIALWNFHGNPGFPMWQDSVETPSQEGLSVSFVRMLFDAEPEKDAVEVQIKNTNDLDSSYGKSYWIEFYDAGKWHLIYHIGPVPAVNNYIDGRTELEARYLVPAGLFSKSGRYRLVIGDLGSCEFEYESVDD